MSKIKLTLLFLVFFSIEMQAQKDSTIVPEKKKAWYENINLRGYSHMRYNRLAETNSGLKCDQCDKSIGAGNSIFLRRARLTVSGNVHERIYIYIQTDFANNAVTTATPAVISQMHFLQLRDLYGDIFLDSKKTLKARVGISKVPFGFDNLQSSQNRIAFDRSDAINSAAYNERDHGVFLYWTPAFLKDRFKELQSNFKGTGDYGVLGFGVYNGQTINRVEQNNAMHTAARVTYPFLIKGKQFVEIGANAYSGYFGVKEFVNPGVTAAKDYLDRRIGGYFVLYPKPLGIQAEYNWGEGPEFKNGPSGFSIARRHLEGGYIQTMWMQKFGKMTVTPYYRYQYYNGGKKIEADTRSHLVKEHEGGIEWQVFSALELTAAYVASNRIFEDSKNPTNHKKGQLIRLQVQFNY